MLPIGTLWNASFSSSQDAMPSFDSSPMPWRVWFCQREDLGRVSVGCLAEPSLVDGDPLIDVTPLEDADRFVGITKDGISQKDPGSRSAAANSA